MKRLVLARDESSDHGTLGMLFGAGGPPLHVIELPWRENRRDRSRIPAGAYDVAPHRSPRFGRALLVLGVPGRSHVLFHSGNLAGDVALGLLTHTRGCLLPGLRRGALTAGGRRQRAVLASRPAMRALLDRAGDAPFRLDILDPVEPLDPLYKESPDA